MKVINKAMHKIAIALLIFTTSCSNLLEIRETDFIAGDAALITVEDHEKLLISAYAGLQNFNPGVPVLRPETVTDYEMNIRYNGILSDELKPSEFPSLNTMHEWTFAFDDVGLRGNFMPNVGYYRVIERVNRVLNSIANATSVNPGDDQKRTVVTGEALFLRAFAHFELFRYFCKNYDPDGLGMPYIDVPQANPQAVHARIMMREYFESILRDVTDAKELVVPGLADKNRANRLTVSAFQARTALYMRDWNNAALYSTEYINALPLANQDAFVGIWTDENTEEVSWRLFRTTSNRLGSFFRAISGTSSAGPVIATVTWVPSDKLWNSFDQENDIRFRSYFIDEPLLSNSNRYSRILHKYRGTGYYTNNENVAHVKVFRTAEMYLIRAEAHAELGNLSGASSDLNDLRAARISNYNRVALNSREEAISEILNERFKELALEGHRFWDLKRKSMPVERLPVDAPQVTSQTLPANNFRFVLPIPRWEMEANPLMVQNEGYTGAP